MPAAPVLFGMWTMSTPARRGEDLHVEVREAADAGAGVADLAGILLGVVDQVRHAS